MTDIVWVKYRINSRSSQGEWQWMPLRVSSLDKADAEARCRMEEMISEEALHSEYGRSGDWDIETPPTEVVMAEIKKLQKQADALTKWSFELLRFA